MKLSLLFLATIVFSAAAIAAETPAPSPKPSYQEFLKQYLQPENVAECISGMDRLIDAGEEAAASTQPGTGWVSITIKSGLHLQFRINDREEAIIYYVIISRGGEELKYSDAAKIAALFADRAALPHPVDLTEGDKPVFYAQWLIKPKEWKAVRKMMLKVRSENRSVKDPMKAFELAIDREMSARETALRSQ